MAIYVHFNMATYIFLLYMYNRLVHIWVVIGRPVVE